MSQTMNLNRILLKKLLCQFFIVIGTITTLSGIIIPQFTYLDSGTISILLGTAILSFALFMFVYWHRWFDNFLFEDVNIAEQKLKELHTSHGIVVENIKIAEQKLKGLSDSVIAKENHLKLLSVKINEEMKNTLQSIQGLKYVKIDVIKNYDTYVHAKLNDKVSVAILKSNIHDALLERRKFYALVTAITDLQIDGLTVVSIDSASKQMFKDIVTDAVNDRHLIGMEVIKFIPSQTASVNIFRIKNAPKIKIKKIAAELRDITGI